MEANIKMKANTRNYTDFLDNGETDFYCHNLEFFNEVYNLNDKTMGKEYESCIGVWKIKQLKQ